jgi:hypothetical protein
MDIVKKIRPLKATYESLCWYHKLASTVIILALMMTLFPQKSFASAEQETFVPQKLVFEAGDHTQFMDELFNEASFQYRHETAVQKLQRQLKMNDALKKYLQSKRSPLAEYSATILQQNNWKKIVALSNAESSLCRKYIEDTSNCWGVGGSNLWDMGDNLGEGVVAMNKFLNTAPAKSKVKYSQMNFDQMNGLYKQPARDHWVYNNLEIYNELTALEKNMK